MPQHIPPQSGSPYIIICSMKIGIAIGANDTDKIQAASRGVTELASFMQLYYKHFNLADCLPLATLQHALMDHVLGDEPLTPAQIDEKIKSIVKEAYVLEKKYQVASQ